MQQQHAAFYFGILEWSLPEIRSSFVKHYLGMDIFESMIDSLRFPNLVMLFRAVYPMLSTDIFPCSVELWGDKLHDPQSKAP
jgi:hypothetical protein